MKKLFVSASLLFLTLNSAWAAPTPENSKIFAGPAIAIGGSSVGINSTFKHQSSSGSSEFSVGDNNLVAVVNASYLKDVSDKWLIGGGITYDLNSMKNNTARFYDITFGSYATTVKSENHVSVYVQPTYALSETTALFLKVAYHQTQVRISDDYIYTFSNQKKDLHGLGLGFGAMIFLDKNIFTKLELEYVNYSKLNIPYSTTNIGYKLKTTSGTLSIGYRF